MDGAIDSVINASQHHHTRHHPPPPHQQHPDPAVIVCDADLWPLLHAAVSSSPNSSLRAIILLYTDEPVSSSKPLPPFTHPAAAATAASCRVLRHEEALGLLREGGGGEGEVEVEGDDTQCLVYTSGRHKPINHKEERGGGREIDDH